MTRRIFRSLAYAFLLCFNVAFSQWVQTNGPYSGKIWSFAVCGTNFFVGTNGEGVLRSSDNGATWTAVNVGIVEKSVYSFAVSPASGGTGGTNIFAGTNGSVYVSTNDGSSWNSISSGLPASYINALTVAGTNFWAGTGRGVFRSTNNGSTWTAAGLTGNSIYAVAVCGTKLWAASRTGSAGVAYCSDDNGMSWTGYVLSSRDVSAFAVSGANLFAGGYAGVHRTTNNGTNWTLGLASEIVYSLALFGTNLFAGTFGGVWLSTDNGTSWMKVSTGLTNPYINALAVHGTNLFAGTDAGVFKRPISEMVTSVERSPTDLPTHFSLEQNYPNPFNPSTKIQFSIPNASFVSLKVFDALGREVSILVAEELAAGIHTRHLDGAALPSGVYFYRLQAGEYLQTKKAIVLK